MAQFDLDNSDIWRQVPPEEKFELMARAHASGVFAAFIAVILSGTMAIGFKLGWHVRSSADPWCR